MSVNIEIVSYIWMSDNRPLFKNLLEEWQIRERQCTQRQSMGRQCTERQCTQRQYTASMHGLPIHGSSMYGASMHTTSVYSVNARIGNAWSVNAASQCYSISVMYNGDALCQYKNVFFISLWLYISVIHSTMLLQLYYDVSLCLFILFK